MSIVWSSDAESLLSDWLQREHERLDRYVVGDPEGVTDGLALIGIDTLELRKRAEALAAEAAREQPKVVRQEDVSCAIRQKKTKTRMEIERAVDAESLM